MYWNMLALQFPMPFSNKQDYMYTIKFYNSQQTNCLSLNYNNLKVINVHSSKADVTKGPI